MLLGKIKLLRYNHVMEHKQEGFVSIITASILMILLALIAMGFFTIMQREQRQSLDSQLNSQAYYAAETAVNDINSLLENGALKYEGPGTDPRYEEKTDCNVDDPLFNGNINNSQTVDLNSGLIDATDDAIQYSCILYDQTPTDLLFTESITVDSSKIIPIQHKKRSDGTYPSIESIKLEWNGPPNARNSEGKYEYASATCGSTPIELTSKDSYDINWVSMLRVDLISAPLSGFSRASLRASTASLYLYPKNNCGSNSIVFTNVIGADTREVIEVNCEEDLGAPDAGCMFNIDTSSAASNRFYLRIRSIYNPVQTLRITASDGTPTPFEFEGAQVLVDSTGRANDVLQRLEARISLTEDFNVPEAVVRGLNGICKTIQYAPPDVVNNANCY